MTRTIKRDFLGRFSIRDLMPNALPTFLCFLLSSNSIFANNEGSLNQTHLPRENLCHDTLETSPASGALNKVNRELSSFKPEDSVFSWIETPLQNSHIPTLDRFKMGV